jgi:16S rRNA (uracil1498-N3)-methyltransferase
MHHNRPGPGFNESLLMINDCLIIPALMRRFHTPKLITGLNPLDARQGKHARDVLRLESGAQVELFDDSGAVAAGLLIYEGNRASVQVDRVNEDSIGSVTITVAAAVPKGERADWMVEKLSELGVARFIPLAAERSVVVPEGTHKLERWARIATESAKQSRRRGVMCVDPVSKLAEVISPKAVCLSTEVEAPPLHKLLDKLETVTLLIGPEGGWTPGEIEQMKSAGVHFARLTNSILRTETAAIAAAAVCAMLIPDRIDL